MINTFIKRNSTKNQWRYQQLLKFVYVMSPPPTSKGPDVGGQGYCTTFQIVYIELLTQWSRDKIDAILQTTFSNTIFLMKMFEFRLKFHWSLLPCSQRSNEQYSSIVSDNGLVPNRRQTIIWTNEDRVQRRIYASLVVNEVSYLCYGDCVHFEAVGWIE